MQGATKKIVLGKNVSGKADIQPNVKFTRGEAAKIIVIGKNLSGKSDVLPSAQVARGETIKTDVLPTEIEIKDAVIKKGKIFADINSLLNLFGEKPKDIKINAKLPVSKNTPDTPDTNGSIQKIRRLDFTVYYDAVICEKYEFIAPGPGETKKLTLYQVEAEPFVELLNWVFEKTVELETREKKVLVNMSSALYGNTKVSGRLTTGFDGYKNIVGRHQGIDFQFENKPPEPRTKIYALTAGKVTVTYSTDTSGNLITNGLTQIAVYDKDATITDKKGGVTVLYLHSVPLVKTGDEVDIDDVIGYEWNNGMDGGAYHTHVEVCDGERTQAAKSRGNTKLENPDPTNFG